MSGPRSAKAHAERHLANMPMERRKQLEREWRGKFDLPDFPTRNAMKVVK